MGKFLILILTIGFISLGAKADQMTSFTDEQVDSTLKLLKTHKVIMIYCGCCDNDKPSYVRVTKIYKKRYTEATWEIWYIGKDQNGKRVKTFIDAAYTYVKVGDNAVSCCTLMKFDCNPCTQPFLWKK